MHTPAVRLPTVSHRSGLIAAACAAALAVSAATVMTSGDDATAPAVAPAVVRVFRVRRVGPQPVRRRAAAPPRRPGRSGRRTQTVLAPAQRRAAERFHHR